MEYVYKTLNSKKIYRVIVNNGDVVYTPPGEIHKMIFLKDSVFVAMTTEKRDQKLYEQDTVRVNLWNQNRKSGKLSDVVSAMIQIFPEFFPWDNHRSLMRL